LYRLIWRRFIASQMKPAIYDTVTVDIETLISGSQTIYLFRATGSTLRFAGFLKVYGVDVDAEESRGKRGEGEVEPRADDEGRENESMPELAKGDDLTLHQLLPRQHFTQPPKRYSEAQLIGALKKLGLGRPSTYATIVETLKDRKYVAVEQKRLYPTSLGFQVCELLEKHIQMVVDVQFTAHMEEDLDRIARGETDRLTVMREFYLPFKATVDQALAAAAKERQPAAKVAQRSSSKRRARSSSKKSSTQASSPKEGQACPLCKEGVLQLKSGKFGAFLGCSRYALGCQYTENIGGKRKQPRKRTTRRSKSRSK
jgi:DNA topoisomerase-1